MLASTFSLKIPRSTSYIQICTGAVIDVFASADPGLITSKKELIATRSTQILELT